MKQLVIDEQTARDLYSSADPGLKAILNCSFGEKAFKVKKPFNEILTLDDIFEAAGADPNDPKYHLGAPDEIGYHLVKLLPLALNPKDWKPDFNNQDQRKWSPWFWLDKPGFRFHGSGYSGTHTFSAGGSRLCFAEKPISDHAGEQFVKLYEKWLA